MRLVSLSLLLCSLTCWNGPFLCFFDLVLITVEVPSFTLMMQVSSTHRFLQASVACFPVHVGSLLYASRVSFTFYPTCSFFDIKSVYYHCKVVHLSSFLDSEYSISIFLTSPHPDSLDLKFCFHDDLICDLQHEVSCSRRCTLRILTATSITRFLRSKTEEGMVD